MSTVDELVDLGEAAERLDLKRSTLKMYLLGTRHEHSPGCDEIIEKDGKERRRCEMDRFDVGFPEEDYRIGTKPVWRWSTIDGWARESGRGKYRATK